MKHTPRKSILTASLLAAAAAALLAPSAPAQQTVTVTPGDLVLGFEETGSTSDYVVDIGPASFYLNLAANPGTTDINTSSATPNGLGNIAQDLANTFNTQTTTWNSAQSTDNVQWGVVGAGSKLTVIDGLPKDTLLFTQVEPSTAPAEKSSSNQSTPVGNVGNLITAGNGFDNATSTSNSDYGVVESEASFPSTSWTAYTPSTNAFGSGLDIETSSSYSPTDPTNSVLDLYELVPSTTGGKGTLLGDFTLSNNGTLDFTSADVVPEPSTYALLFGGLGLLFWFQRLRRKSSAA